MDNIDLKWALDELDKAKARIASLEDDASLLEAEYHQQSEIIGRHTDDCDKLMMEKRGVEAELADAKARIEKAREALNIWPDARSLSQTWHKNRCFSAVSTALAAEERTGEGE